MRIVGGIHGGRVLAAPPGQATRPTSEKVRQALFNILGDVSGDHVLDVFAGSGALGLEALSRGAASATFFDLAKPALTAIRKNVADLGVADRAVIVAGDAVSLVAKHTPSHPYRIVFVDPPYRSDLAARAVAAIPRTALADDATVVIEYDRRNAPPETLGSVLRTDERRYGDTYVAFYKVPAEATP